METLDKLILLPFSLFILYPWLAAIVGVMFGFVYRKSGNRTVGIAALLWLAYSGYEFAIHERWICSGECNIRVDLLLIYPVLFLVSLIAAIRVRRAFRVKRDNVAQV